MKTEVERFWEKTRSQDNGCIEWTASFNGRGYGQFRLLGQRKNITAHRFSWILANGQIPNGLCVCHKCDNRSCVNPEHLFLGTFADNSADMVAKNRGRGAKRNGSLNPRAKLSEVDVESIRHSSVSLSKLAEAFGISKSQAHRIKTGAAWSAITQ